MSGEHVMGVWRVCCESVMGVWMSGEHVMGVWRVCGEPVMVCVGCVEDEW